MEDLASGIESMSIGRPKRTRTSERKCLNPILPNTPNKENPETEGKMSPSTPGPSGTGNIGKGDGLASAPQGGGGEVREEEEGLEEKEEVQRRGGEEKGQRRGGEEEAEAHEEEDEEEDEDKEEFEEELEEKEEEEEERSGGGVEEEKEEADEESENEENNGEDEEINPPEVVHPGPPPRIDMDYVLTELMPSAYSCRDGNNTGQCASIMYGYWEHPFKGHADIDPVSWDQKNPTGPYTHCEEDLLSKLKKIVDDASRKVEWVVLFTELHPCESCFEYICEFAKSKSGIKFEISFKAEKWKVGPEFCEVYRNKKHIIPANVEFYNVARKKYYPL